jgi:hypothetical protein
MTYWVFELGRVLSGGLFVLWWSEQSLAADGLSFNCWQRFCAHSYAHVCWPCCWVELVLSACCWFVCSVVV